jgi:hypothetical protein
MTPDERSDIQNGIWLCSTCSKLVDSDEAKYPPEVLRRWKAEHEETVSRELANSALLNKRFVEAVARLSIYEQSAGTRSGLDVKLSSRRNIVSASDLVRTGFRTDRVHLILNDQQESLAKQNYRLTEFLNSIVDPSLHDVPRQWRALIAGLPIVGKDIGSESLNKMAELAAEVHPYLSRDLRTMYHTRLRSTIIGVLAEVQSFIDDSARAGGLPLGISGGPLTTWWDMLPWGSWGLGRSYKVDDSLLQGRWFHIFPREVVEHKIDIARTWAGFLFDVVSRLPDPDRQKGRLLRRLDFMTLMYIWCATAPQDFRPPLTGMVRYPPNSTDHTLAGLYKRMKEQSDVAEAKQGS